VEPADNTPPETGAFAVRAATAGDTDEIIRLAGLMYEAMGTDASAGDWREAARANLATRLGRDVAVFVADDPCDPGRLAATGAGTIVRRLPGPANPAALAGYIQWVSTDQRWQRRGLARQITAALLGWFAARDVRSIELHATEQGEPLYRSLGFGPGENPGLRIRLAPGPPGDVSGQGLRPRRGGCGSPLGEKALVDIGAVEPGPADRAVAGLRDPADRVGPVQVATGGRCAASRRCCAGG
jgi:GNAT superfamily N-acetyltransferase